MDFLKCSSAAASVGCGDESVTRAFEMNRNASQLIAAMSNRSASACKTAGRRRFFVHASDPTLLEISFDIVGSCAALPPRRGSDCDVLFGLPLGCETLLGSSPVGSMERLA